MHLSLPEWFPLLNLASSVCKSLKCLISALTQGGKGGHLFRLTGSFVLWGGRSMANKYLWRVWGVLTPVACAFQIYPAQTPGCSEGELSKAGPGLLAHPRPKLLRFRFSGTPQGGRLGWACVLCPPQVLAARATRCLVSTLPQVNGVSYHLPGPTRLVSGVHRKSAVSGVLCVSSGALISGCDPPGRCQPSRIPGRHG